MRRNAKGGSTMKVFLNAGHAPDGNPDPGACGYGLRECDVAKSVADLVADYLTAAGVAVLAAVACARGPTATIAVAPPFASSSTVMIGVDSSVRI